MDIASISFTHPSSQYVPWLTSFLKLKNFFSFTLLIVSLTSHALRVSVILKLSCIFITNEKQFHPVPLRGYRKENNKSV